MGYQNSISMGTFSTAEENLYSTRDKEQSTHFGIMQGHLCSDAPTKAQSGRPGMLGDFTSLTDKHQDEYYGDVYLKRMVLDGFAAACFCWAEITNLA